MGHGIAIRHDLIPGMGNSYMREVAEHADVPVINMQCDIDHPTQTPRRPDDHPRAVRH